NALYAPSWNGYVEVVKLLLLSGAEATATAGKYPKSVEGCAIWPLEKDMLMLIDAQADHHSSRNGYDDLLPWTSAVGFERIGRALIDRGADVNIRKATYGTALQAA
ncbi:hypothetical protein LY78DRAFT_555066, partial [Colletotrichum sublineola]